MTKTESCDVNAILYPTAKGGSPPTASAFAGPFDKLNAGKLRANAQMTGSASATPPQGGSDWTVKRALWFANTLWSRLNKPKPRYVPLMNPPFKGTIPKHPDSCVGPGIFFCVRSRPRISEADLAELIRHFGITINRICQNGIYIPQKRDLYSDSSSVIFRYIYINY